MPEPLDILGTIEQMQREIEASQHQRVDYIVLDHDVPPMAAIVVERDKADRRFVRISPSLVDGIKQERVDYSSLNLRLFSGDVKLLIGIPVYKREDMKEGWPY